MAVIMPVVVARRTALFAETSNDTAAWANAAGRGNRPGADNGNNVHFWLELVDPGLLSNAQHLTVNCSRADFQNAKLQTIDADNIMCSL